MGACVCVDSLELIAKSGYNSNTAVGEVSAMIVSSSFFTQQ